MKTIAAQEIKRRGISAVDELLAEGPVHIIKNNRPRYVVMSEEDYSRLAQRPALWDWLDRPAGDARSVESIDAQLRGEREAWGETP